MKNRHLYPPHWEDTIRPAILKRDGYRCQVCGLAHRATVIKESDGSLIPADNFMQEWAKKNGKKIFTVFLQIAHLDHNKSNCEESNLKAMCPRCHLNNDREHNSILRKLQGRQQPKKF